MCDSESVGESDDLGWVGWVVVSWLVSLTAVFVVLRLCSMITWSWWWVFSPLWAPFLCVCIVSWVLSAGKMGWDG